MLWLRGEHDVATVGVLRDTLTRVIAADDTDVVVDLRWACFIDAATIGAMLNSRETLTRQSRRLTVRSPSTRALHILSICRLTDLVEPEEDAAGH